MGGLRRLDALDVAAFLVGGLALVGIPPFAGFFSKDSILAAALDRGWYGDVLWAAGLAGTFLTGALHVPPASSSSSAARSPRSCEEHPPAPPRTTRSPGGRSMMPGRHPRGAVGGRRLDPVRRRLDARLRLVLADRAAARRGDQHAGGRHERSLAVALGVARHRHRLGLSTAPARSRCPAPRPSARCSSTSSTSTSSTTRSSTGRPSRSPGSSTPSSRRRSSAARSRGVAARRAARRAASPPPDRARPPVRARDRRSALAVLAIVFVAVAMSSWITTS